MGGDPAQAEREIVAAGADGHGYRYTDAEMFSSASEIIERLPSEKTWPSTTDWSRERARILEDERAAGKPPRAIPGANVLRTRFGSWAKARYAYERRGERA